MKLNDKLQDPALKGKVIYFYCGQHPHRRANAAFLIAAWAMMYLGQARATVSPFPRGNERNNLGREFL